MTSLMLENIFFLFQISDLLKIHENKCPSFNKREIQLSCDGVSENKSNSVSIDVYSLSFKNCKNIYPYKLVRPLNKQLSGLQSRRILWEVLTEITENDLRILQYIADNPKRSIARECKSHSAWYACEYCYAKGKKIELTPNTHAINRLTTQINLINEKINDCEAEENTPDKAEKIRNLLSLKENLQKGLNAMKKKSHILWPFSTMKSINRTRNSLLEIAEKLENNELLSIDESKGVLGRSLLFNVPDFNFIYDMPAEYMHLSYLGVIKRMVELTFDVGVKRTRITKRKLSNTKLFNQLMLCTKVPREFPRRARILDFCVYKAQEFRNIVLFFFPIVLECIEPNSKEIPL